MFEHLDDNTPHRTGTPPQLAAVRNRARQISSERRRNKVALGSVTLAATAVVSGAAAASSLTGSGSATGQAGTSGGAKPTDPTAVPASKSSLEPNLKKTFDPSADAAKASKLASDGLSPANASEGPVSPKPVCDPALPSLDRVTPPSGYSVVDTPDQIWAEYVGGGGVSVTVKVVCSPLQDAETMAKDGQLVSPAQVGGHPAIQWTTKDDGQIGVGFATKAGAIYVKAAGPAASRLTLAELEAFAATVPTAS